MEKQKTLKSLVVGRGRFPLFPAIRISDADLVRNLAITSPDTDLRRRHIEEVLVQQTRRGGSWVYIVTDSQDARLGIYALQRDAKAAGREDDFVVVELNGTGYTQVIAEPDKLCCVIVSDRIEDKDLMRDGLADVCRRLESRYEDLDGPHSDLPYIVAVEDLLQLVAINEPNDEGDIARMVSALERSRAINTAFVMGVKGWRSSRMMGLVRRVTANIRNHIVHSGASVIECEVLPEFLHRFDELSRQPAGRFALTQRTNKIVFGRLPNNLSKVAG